MIIESIDATRGRNTDAEPSILESVHRFDDMTTTLLHTMVGIAERLPVDSLLRQAIVLQSRELLNIFGTHEATRYRAINIEARSKS
jgi:hypothetical protein